MKNSKVTVVTDILLLVLSFVMLLTCIIADKYAMSVKLAYMRVFQNQDLWPVSQIVTAKSRCPIGYDKIYNSTYPGNERGCYDTKAKEYHHGACSSGKSDLIDIPETKPTSTELWRGRLICVKRTNIYQMKHKYLPANSVCPKDYKYCGMVNTNKDILCLDEKEKCPVNFIKITRDVRQYEDLYEMIELDEYVYLVFGNDNTTNLFIPVDFKLSQGFPCLRSERFANTTPAYPYLIKQPAFGCDPENPLAYDKEYLDERYELIEELDRMSFYLFNDLDKVANLPSMKAWRNHINSKIGLYSRTKVAPKISCDPDRTKTAAFVKKLTSAKFYQFLMIVFQLANIFILCLFMSLLSIMKVGNKAQNIIVSLIKILYCVTFISVNVYVLNLCSKSHDEINSYIAELAKDECIDSVTNYSFTTIHHFRHYMNRWRFRITIIFWYCVPYAILVLIQAGKYIHKMYHRIRHRKRNEQARKALVEKARKSKASSIKSKKEVTI